MCACNCFCVVNITFPYEATPKKNGVQIIASRFEEAGTKVEIFNVNILMFCNFQLSIFVHCLHDFFL